MNIQNAPSGTIRAALRYPAFRSLLSALAVSQVGDWLYNLALVMLVYDRTHSPAWAGVTTAARVVPIVALGPLGGVLADRFDRRRLMLTSDLARMGLMVLLAAVAAARLPILLAPVIAAMATAAAAPYLPCVAAVTPAWSTTPTCRAPTRPGPRSLASASFSGLPSAASCCSSGRPPSRSR